MSMINNRSTRDSGSNTLPSTSSTSGLISTVALFPAVSISVDVLRPDYPVAMFVGSPRAVDENIRQLAEDVNAHKSGDMSHDVHLPPPWVRLALVKGVDRWLDVRIDEVLLTADRALALQEAGEVEAAQDLWTPTVIARLEEYSDALASSGRETPASIRRELARLVAAFPDLDLHPDSVLPAALGATTTAASTVTAATNTDEHDPDEVFQSIIDRFSAAPRVVAIDLLHVPARVVGTDLAMSPLDSRNVQVSAPAFPGMTVDEPASRRLLSRLVETGTGTVVSLGTFTLNPETSSFEGTLPLRGRRYSDVTVDVFDSNVPSTPRVTTTSAADRDALVHAQRAFVSGRLAAAHHAVGNTTAGQALGESAALELGQLGSSPTTIEQYRTSLNKALETATAASNDYERSDPALGPDRSLLSELEAAHRASP